jgi:hypothetical protein
MAESIGINSANVAYSKEGSTSAEKEDKDIFTYKHARIGGKVQSGIVDLPANEAASEAPAEYFTIDSMRVAEPSHGLYIIRRGDKVSKMIL